MRYKTKFLSATMLAFAAALLSTAAAAQEQEQEAPAARAQGFPVGPPSRITAFTAEPTTIQPGQPVTLTWAAINSDNMSIDQCVGIAPARGSRQVSPSVTTTYTLSAKGRGGNDKQSVTVTVPGTTPAAGCADAKDKPIPRMGDHPDLSGVYIGGFGIVPMEKITLKPGAEHFKMTVQELELGATVTCLPP